MTRQGNRLTTRLAGIILALAAVMGVGATSASAQATPDWNCRASAVRLTLVDQATVEPVVANRAFAPCAPDAAGAANADLVPNAIPLGSTQDAFARTDRLPTSGGIGAQTVSADAGASHVTLGSAQAGFLLDLQGVTSHAEGMCLGSQGGRLSPVFTGRSNVVTVKLNDQTISLDPLLQQIQTSLQGSPLDALLAIRFNEVSFDGDTYIRRAVHLIVAKATPDHASLLDVAVGESKLGSQGDLCNLNQPPPLNCPVGSEFDPHGYCVIIKIVPGTGDEHNPCPAGSFQRVDGTCVTGTLTAPIGSTNGGANGQSGGTVVPIGSVPASRLGPCNRKPYNESGVVILGTNAADKITGSNGPDIILAGGGNDSVSGGRGADCIRGESGKDSLDGSVGADRVLGDSGSDKVRGGGNNDRVEGGSGRDFLNGGGGNDLLLGGSGRDFITAASGRDVVNAGTGNDQINAAKAGPPSRINCGPGRDIVKVNTNELRTIRNCESRQLLRHIP